MQFLPMGKTTQGVILFENQVIGDRQNLLIMLREDGLKVRVYACLFANLIEQITCPIEDSSDLRHRDRPWLNFR
ncbi:hypothetical protein SDC9_168778 [bioreactor metagenome]|uniref:Uncharacterized protein n=1 Tax=bioreactor metagenome TaxID=1076179 RepID=A0A645G6G3_9ZZZZ